jgi:shikimate kinase
MEETTIVLIGPICAGKSSVAKILAAKLGLPQYTMDDLRWELFADTDYDKNVARQLHEAGDTLGRLEYMKPFEAVAVERIVAEKRGGVIDFGAGHSVYEDEELLGRVERALAPVEYVILLLPSPDPDESTRVLNARFRELLDREVGQVDEKLLALNEHFVRHPSIRRLAKLVVYTGGKTAEETAEEIAAGILDTG